MFDHGIENSEQLAHASDQGDFEQFAVSFEPFVKGSNHGIASGGDQGGHVKSAAHRGSTTPDGAPAFEGATVAIEGGDASESGNLSTIESPELRQFSEQCSAGDRTDALNTAQQIFVLFPDRILLDGSVEVSVGALEILFQPSDVSMDAFSDGLGGHLQPVFLGTDGCEEVSAARGQCPQLHSDGIWQGAQLWANRLGKMSQDIGIDAVGLSQLTGGFSEVSDLAWVDHDCRQIGTHHSAHDMTFIAPGGFQHDQGGWDLSQPFDQGLDADFVVGKTIFLAGGANRDIELCFGHIDADKDKGTFQDAILLNDFTMLQLSSTLRKMRAWLAPATVRAFWEPEWDGPCYDTASNDRGADGLSHPVSY